MKRYMIPISIFLVFIFPNLIYSIGIKRQSQVELPVVTATQPEQVQMTILVSDDTNILEMTLDEYTLGVLLGEMPAEFESEALKAQAIAIRTYTLRRILHPSKHSNADVCTDASCCQAYIDADTYTEKGGTEVSLMKMKAAVTETSGHVITYEGELIEATYFSCSGGITEDAVAVWGTDVPYLQSVISPGEENTKHYLTSYRYSVQEFLKKLELPDTMHLNDASFVITYTEGDGVANMYIDNYAFSGQQIRSILNLPSTAFQLSVEDQTVVIYVKGNGHRVGMSQYGAEAMAVSGNSFAEILTHYYPGTKIERFTPEQMKAVFDKAGKL